MIVLSKSASCDESTREVSLFQVVIHAKHTLSDYGLIRPYSASFFLESETTGFDVEVRTAWIARAIAPVEPFEDPTVVHIDCQRTHLRRNVCRLPQMPGTYDLVLDWHAVGQTLWRRCSARFPVIFEERT